MVPEYSPRPHKNTREKKQQKVSFIYEIELVEKKQRAGSKEKYRSRIAPALAYIIKKAGKCSGKQCRDHADGRSEHFPVKEQRNENRPRPEKLIDKNRHDDGAAGLYNEMQQQHIPGRNAVVVKTVKIAEIDMPRNEQKVPVIVVQLVKRGGNVDDDFDDEIGCCEQYRRENFIR